MINQLKSVVLKKFQEDYKKDEKKVYQIKNSNFKESIAKNIQNLNDKLIKMKSKAIDDNLNKLNQNLQKEKEKVLNNVPYGYTVSEFELNKKIAELKEKQTKIIKDDIEKKFQDIKVKEEIRIKNELEKQIEENYRKNLNMIKKAKLDKENNLNKAIEKEFERLNKIKTDIADMENAIKDKQMLRYSNLFDKKNLVEKIYLNVIGYYENKKDDKTISFAPIRGGCLSEINNNLKFIDISNNSQNEEFNEILEKIENSEEIHLQGKNYSKISLNLLQGYLNEDFCR